MIEFLTEWSIDDPKWLYLCLLGDGYFGLN